MAMWVDVLSMFHCLVLVRVASLRTSSLSSAGADPGGGAMPPPPPPGSASASFIIALHPFPPSHFQKCLHISSLPPSMPCTVFSLSCFVTPVIFQISSLAFYSRHFLPSVFILMQLYCLYCTDEGHCIVTKRFDTNLRLGCYSVGARAK